MAYAPAPQAPDLSLQLTAPTTELSLADKLGLGLLAAGVLVLLLAWTGPGASHSALTFWGSFGLMTAGALVYVWRYLRRPAGVQNDGIWFSSTTARGAVGWILGIVFTGGYVLLYWVDGAFENLVRMMDPLSWMLRGKVADKWFLYGAVYTMLVLVMGVRAMFKYRHSTYHLIRTGSVMFFQLGFAFLIPSILQAFDQPEFYFSYFWPLKYDYLWPGTVGYLTETGGALGVFMIFWGAVMIAVVTPILTYFFGKRWYCSWVCGCGGLAETAGDPFRHLSDKSLGAWKIERWMIHSVLVFVVLTTAMLWINSATGGGILGDASQGFSKTYGFLIGAVFSGVVGVGFYPIMGSRVWCRFGCPMAAILGMQQRFFSRFRITTNGGQCISCGNCSAYCEMGIDVRWYAQRGQNIIRSSCVGCGVCATVCPRGVLKLENGPREGRYNGPVLIERDSVSVLTDDLVLGGSMGYLPSPSDTVTHGG